MAQLHTTHTYLEVTQTKRQFWLTSMTAKDLVNISYVARRGETTERGAVQRLLNPKRISRIKDFATEVGDFPGCIILNWVNSDYPIKKLARELRIPRRRNSAQIIDGQHRVAGLEEAINSEAKIGKLEIPVAIYEGLDTRECADIFLSINTEQKPVPKSLVFDLYGEASDFIVDHAVVRAKDVAEALRDDENSPYNGFIKFPGSPPRERGIPLSTVVSALKPLVEEKGGFEQTGLIEFHMQKQFLLNFFNVLRNNYGADWSDKTNVFRYSAGFTGAIEFIKNKLLGYCNINDDFTESSISNAFSMPKDHLIFQSDIHGLQGRKAFNTVAELLDACFNPQVRSRKSIKV